MAGLAYGGWYLFFTKTVYLAVSDVRKNFQDAYSLETSNTWEFDDKGRLLSYETEMHNDYQLGVDVDIRYAVSYLWDAGLMTELQAECASGDSTDMEWEFGLDYEGRILDQVRCNFSREIDDMEVECDDGRITELRIEIGDTVIEHEYAYNRSGVLQEYTVTTHSDIFERILTKTFNENGKTEREKQETWVDGVLQTRSESSYEYDANGNQIWTETESYAYGETSVTEIEQVYDADGCLLRFWMEFRNETEDGDDFGVSIELADKEYENLDDPENYHPEYRSGRLERRLEVVDYELPKELDAAPNEIEMFEELLDELYIEAVYDDHGNCLEMEFALTGIMETEQETEYVAVRVPRNYQNPSKSDPQWLMTNPIS